MFEDAANSCNTDIVHIDKCLLVSNDHCLDLLQANGIVGNHHVHNRSFLFCSEHSPPTNNVGRCVDSVKVVQ